MAPSVSSAQRSKQFVIRVLAMRCRQTACNFSATPVRSGQSRSCGAGRASSSTESLTDAGAGVTAKSSPSWRTARQVSAVRQGSGWACIVTTAPHPEVGGRSNRQSFGERVRARIKLKAEKATAIRCQGFNLSRHVWSHVIAGLNRLKRLRTLKRHRTAGWGARLCEPALGRVLQRIECFVPAGTKRDRATSSTCERTMDGT